MTDKIINIKSPTILPDDFYSIIKSNLSSHYNKVITEELIATLSQQILESIDYFLLNRDLIKGEILGILPVS